MTPTVKIDPQGLLSRIADCKSSGCLELDEGLVSWKIYSQHGHLMYVCCSAQSLDQLKYHLHHLGWKQALLALKLTSEAEIQHYVEKQTYIEEFSPQDLYGSVISWLLEEKHLNLFQGSKLIEYMTKDALHSCLWLNSGTFSWHDREPIPFWIQKYLGNSLSIRVSECLSVEKERLQQWQKCCTDLLSVHQRPYFASGWQQKTLPVSGSLNYKTLAKLSKVLQGKTSIRQLSLLLQKDELYVAQILSPYVESKIIYLRDARSPLDLLPTIPQSLKNSPHSSEIRSSDGKIKSIVCIDDSPIILQEIERFLGKENFKITAINDPVKAVPIIFRIKPDLILLDITMPRINGYKLCKLLRGSEHCRNTNIVMVTGNTGLINKTKAKIAGATDYLTKPFTKEGLLQVIKKYLK